MDPARKLSSPSWQPPWSATWRLPLLTRSASPRLIRSRPDCRSLRKNRACGSSPAGNRERGASAFPEPRYVRGQRRPREHGVGTKQEPCGESARRTDAAGAARGAGDPGRRENRRRRDRGGGRSGAASWSAIRFRVLGTESRRAAIPDRVVRLAHAPASQKGTFRFSLQFFQAGARLHPCV